MLDLDTFEAIARRRRSVRAFLPRIVDRALLERIVNIAGTAPSSCNSQPWHLHIVSGTTLGSIRAALIEAARAGTPRRPEVQSAASYQGVYRERQIDAAVKLFAAQGVERHDQAARMTSFLRNFAFFDAPHAAFLYMPRTGGVREAADCGKLAQTFMLALAAAGIGSCPQGSLSDYPDIVRDALGLDNEGRLLLGISFGYANNADPTTNVRLKRATLRELANFYD